MRRFYYGAADFIRNKYHLDQLPDRVTALHDGTIEVVHDRCKLYAPANRMFRLALNYQQLDHFLDELKHLCQSNMRELNMAEISK